MGSAPSPIKLLMTFRFLYALFICMDVNFRLKNNLVSNFSVDPGLGIGMAYMLGLGAYEEYVLSQADEEDVSTLSIFAQCTILRPLYR